MLRRCSTMAVLLLDREWEADTYKRCHFLALPELVKARGLCLCFLQEAESTFWLKRSPHSEGSSFIEGRSSNGLKKNSMKPTTNKQWTDWNTEMLDSLMYNWCKSPCEEPYTNLHILSNSRSLSTLQKCYRIPFCTRSFVRETDNRKNAPVLLDKNNDWNNKTLSCLSYTLIWLTSLLSLVVFLLSIPLSLVYCGVWE